MKTLSFLQPLAQTAKSVLPLVAVLLVIQVVVLKKPLADVKSFLIGLAYTVVGLHFFLVGASR